MSKREDELLDASMRRRRSAEAVAADVSSTMFGQLAAEAKETVRVPLSSIKPSPFQSRGEVDEQHIESLANSIAESGLLIPVLLRKLSDSDTFFELVAGHNRVEAFRRLGREDIPAIVRSMSDLEAARALTVENTHHKTLTDWELFKHIQMLRQARAVKNVTDLAAILGCSRAQIYNLEAFGSFNGDVAGLLDRMPGLIGATLAYDLKQYSDHPQTVAEAITLLADGKLKQAGVSQWIRRKVEQPIAPYRKEVAIRGNGKTVRMVITDGEAKVSGDLDFNRLHALIEENISALTKPS